MPTYTGDENNNTIVGSSNADTINGLGGNDILTGGLGADVIFGGAGNDEIRYTVGDGVDTIDGGADGDTLTIAGSDGDDTLHLQINNIQALLSLDGGTVSNVENVAIDLGAGVNTLDFSGNQANLFINLQAGDGISGTIANVDNLVGGKGRNDLTGNGHDNVLVGGPNIDRLSGGDGNDTLVINAGESYSSDRYLGGTGTDTLLLVGSGVVDFASAANLEIDSIEVLRFNGDDDLSTVLPPALTQAPIDNALAVIGDDHVNTIRVQVAGSVSLAAWTFTSWTVGVDTIEIRNSISSTSDTIIGSSVNDIIYVAEGDEASGGDGNDIFHLQQPGVDVINGGDGNDSVAIESETHLANIDTITSIENFQFSGQSTAKVDARQVAANGSLSAIHLIGSVGAVNSFEVLMNSVGGSSVDLSNLTFSSWTAGEDTIVIKSGYPGGLGSPDVNDTIIGSVQGDIIYAGTGDDVITGGLGADTIYGQRGNDTYMVDDIGDVITELVGEGLDTVVSSVDHTLSANVENLVLTGSNALRGIGNNSDNVIAGNAGNNVLKGGDGNDTVSYANAAAGVTVNLAADAAQNTGGGGIDWLFSFENFIGSNFDDTVYGTSATNILRGGAGNDILDGKVGADELIGGVGDDTYVVDNVGDLVVELAYEGIDTVKASVAYTLTANVENLVLTGSAVSGSGNDLANAITGNAWNNVLSGLGGADRFNGGGGSDTVTYVASNVGVNVSLALGVGHGGHAEGDTYINIANVTGSDFDDVLEGNAGFNVLKGGAGNDAVTYANASAAVTITLAVETGQSNAGSGVDTLISIENLTGSNFNDKLIGNGGDNVLNGGAGRDTLVGGGGSDTFSFVFGEANGDTVMDFQGAGSASGDKLVFVGYGDATLTRVGSSSDYLITPDEAHGGSAAAELIHLNGVTNLDLLTGPGHNDFFLV